MTFYNSEQLNDAHNEEERAKTGPLRNTIGTQFLNVLYMMKH